MFLKNQNIVTVVKWARLTRDKYISKNNAPSLYSISLLLLLVYILPKLYFSLEHWHWLLCYLLPKLAKDSMVSI